MSNCNIVSSWLAELEDGPADNYWIVDQLIKRHTRKQMMEGVKPGENDLSFPYFDDQWWIGAKSYVSFM